MGTEDNGFVLNSRNYCCLTIKLTNPIASLYSAIGNFEDR